MDNTSESKTIKELCEETLLKCILLPFKDARSYWFNLFLVCKQWNLVMKRIVDPSYLANQPLMFSCERGNLAAVKNLLEYPTVDPSARIFEAMQKAICFGHWEIFDLLVGHGGFDPRGMIPRVAVPLVLIGDLKRVGKIFAIIFGYVEEHRVHLAEKTELETYSRSKNVIDREISYTKPLPPYYYPIKHICKLIATFHNGHVISGQDMYTLLRTIRKHMPYAILPFPFEFIVTHTNPLGALPGWMPQKSMAYPLGCYSYMLNAHVINESIKYGPISTYRSSRVDNYQMDDSFTISTASQILSYHPVILREHLLFALDHVISGLGGEKIKEFITKVCETRDQNLIIGLLTPTIAEQQNALKILDYKRFASLDDSGDHTERIKFKRTLLHHEGTVMECARQYHLYDVIHHLLYFKISKRYLHKSWIVNRLSEESEDIVKMLCHGATQKQILKYVLAMLRDPPKKNGNAAILLEMLEDVPGDYFGIDMDTKFPKIVHAICINDATSIWAMEIFHRLVKKIRDLVNIKTSLGIVVQIHVKERFTYVYNNKFDQIATSFKRMVDDEINFRNLRQLPFYCESQEEKNRMREQDDLKQSRKRELETEEIVYKVKKFKRSIK